MQDGLYEKMIRQDMINVAKRHIEKVRDSGDTSPIELPSGLLFTGLKLDINVCLHTSLSNGFYHTHDFFEIVYVYKGETDDDVDGDVIRLKCGDALIHNPNAKHAIVRFDDEKDILVNILIAKDVFKKALYHILFNNKDISGFFDSYIKADYGGPNYIVFRNVGNAEKIVDILAEEFYNENGRSTVVMESTLMLLLGAMFRKYEQKREDDALLHEIMQYLSSELKGATLESTAAHFGYHPKYFSSLITHKLNVTFKELLTELRMKKAALLLRLSDMSPDEIAAEVGYKNKSALYARFKSKYGVSPGSYRKA